MAQYRAGVPMDQIVKTFNPRRHRTTLYRRLNYLEEPAREPEKKRQPSGYYVAIVIKRSAAPLVQELLHEARKQRVNCKNLSELAGITRETINGWNRGGIDPKLSSLSAVGRVLGMELTWATSDGSF